MDQEFKEAFDLLTINEKRNQISNELMIIGELIKMAEAKLGLQSLLSVKNYDVNVDDKLSEQEILTFIYEDIYNIHEELLTLIYGLDLLKKQ